MTAELLDVGRHHRFIAEETGPVMAAELRCDLPEEWLMHLGDDGRVFFDLE